VVTVRWPEVPGRPEKDTALDPLAIETVVVGKRPAWRRLGLIGQDAPPLEVRRFSGEALRESMEKVLAGLPADSKAAEVEMGFDARGVQWVGAVKLSAGWSILGGVQYDFGGAWGGQVSLRRVWK